MDHIEAAEIRAAIRNLISRVDLAERRIYATNRRIDSLARSLDDHLNQINYHIHPQPRTETPNHAHLEQPDSRRPAGPCPADPQNAGVEALDRDRHV